MSAGAGGPSLGTLARLGFRYVKWVSRPSEIFTETEFPLLRGD
jgi:hypothetical protein